MPTLRLIPSQTKEKLQISQRAPDHLNVKARRGKRTVVEFPAFRPTRLKSDDSCRPCASGEFLRGSQSRLEMNLESFLIVASANRSRSPEEFAIETTGVRDPEARMRRVSLSFAFDEERITDQDKIEVAGHEVMDRFSDRDRGHYNISGRSPSCVVGCQQI